MLDRGANVLIPLVVGERSVITVCGARDRGIGVNFCNVAYLRDIQLMLVL